MKVSKVLIEQVEIEQKVKELAERINKDYSGEELVIFGILKGAFIVISDLAKQLNVDVTFEFMSIQSYEGTKSTGQIKIDKDLDIDITGKNIANPLAMIQSVGMMLEYSFKEKKYNDLIKKAINNVLTKGYRTADIANNSENVIGTSEMGDILINELNNFKL